MGYTKFTPGEMDQLVEERLISMMEENSPKLLIFFVAQMGKMVVSTNAGEAILSTEATLSGTRYKITCKTTVKKIKAPAPQITQ